MYLALADFVLQTDASDYGVGAVLSQLDSENEKDSGNIAYAPKSSFATRAQILHNGGRSTWHSLLRVYLLGSHFKLVTDHNALRWLPTMEAKDV